MLWVAVKSVDLEAALASGARRPLGDGVVIPLMNGIEHVERLRQQFGAGRVIAGAIRVESERIAPGRIQHISQFAIVDLAPPGRFGSEQRRSLPRSLPPASASTCVMTRVR